MAQVRVKELPQEVEVLTRAFAVAARDDDSICGSLFKFEQVLLFDLHFELAADQTVEELLLEDLLGERIAVQLGLNLNERTFVDLQAC